MLARICSEKDARMMRSGGIKNNADEEEVFLILFLMAVGKLQER